ESPPKTMAAMLPKLADIQRLSSSIIRILGQNPSPFTLQGTNCYLIGTGAKRLMIDTSSPDKPEYIDLVRQVLREERCTVDKLVLTHWHPDHGGSAVALQQMLWTESAAYATVHKFPSLTHPQPPHTDGLVFHNLRDGDLLQCGEVQLKVLHTPGHTDDHLCLLYPTESALFCGDSVLGHGSGVFEDLTGYMRSLRLMQTLPDIRVMYSAHGDVIEQPADKLNEYVEHRMQRINQVQTAVAKAGPSGATPEALVDTVYPEVTDPALRMGALRNLGQALKFLADEGIVECLDGDVWRLARTNKL
ncbi:hypothetical protein BOX15_Mlig001394g1, partial [Macrostomum lignano]